jgi:phospholipid/cholesterol/gamma-HCH transport system substrate-binding protein
MTRVNRTLEIGTGLFVLLGFAALAFLTTQLPGSGVQLRGIDSSFQVSSQRRRSRLRAGDDGGVRIGRVESVGLIPRITRPW